MKQGRKPQGDEPRVIVGSTKLTQSEVNALTARHGSIYAGLRVAVDKMMGAKK